MKRLARAIHAMATACAVLSSLAIALGLASASTAAAQQSDWESDVEQPAEASSAAESAWSDMGAKALDAALWRPVGALASLAGVGFFVASVPFVAPQGAQGIDESWDIFVRTPVEHTFQRSLRDL